MRSPGLIATNTAINYKFFAMLPALSEPVALPPGSAVRIERVRQSADDTVPDRYLHFHGPAELVLINEGAGKFISEAGSFRFSIGTALFAPAMAIHDFAFEPGARAWTLIQFDPLAIDQQVLALPRMASAAFLDADARSRTGSLLDWLGDCLAMGVHEREVTVVLQAFLLSLKGQFQPVPFAEPTIRAQPSRFRPLIEHWVNTPHRVLNLSEAASLCSLSAAYFSRQFKLAFGCGFIRYQTQIRLQQAARLIATTDEPISQIAYRLGYHSPAYFSQCYKAEFCVAPSTQRKAAGAGRNTRV